MFALIDGNSFYCSCERAFNPALLGKPLVVLSNNDGCVIARTNEAKDIGVKMGEPYHLIAKKPEFKSIIWMSSNYVLYGDMSRRMYEVLSEIVPRVEPYSIDEMFLDFRGLQELEQRCLEIRRVVRKVAKIPTCIGIGPTKTLAKLANKVAKADRNGTGVCNFSDEGLRRQLFSTIPLKEVWGMGAASVEKLERMGIKTVSDFVAMPREGVRKSLTVAGLRTHAELSGTQCFPFSVNPPTRKTIAVTRSFGRPITSWEDMREAIVHYTSNAAAKVRRYGLRAGALQVFMHTNMFNNDPRYSSQKTIEIEVTADTFALIKSATGAASEIWREGFRYHKAGIILIDLYRSSDLPVADMFSTQDPEKSTAVMGALDAINSRFGHGTIRPGAIGAAPRWGMRRRNVSPCYTTRLEEVLEVRS
jgi:DNA polymerase V